MFPHGNMMLAGGAYPTFAWNPSDDLNVALSNANRAMTNTSSTQWGGARGTVSRANGSGKYYFECHITALSLQGAVGIDDGTADLHFELGVGGSGGTGSFGYQSQGSIKNNGTTLATGATWGAGDVIGVALDQGAMKLYFAKNGVWQGSMNPAAGTGGIAVNNVTYKPAATLAQQNDALTLDAPFKYPPPRGFQPW